jgi:hypothetical protein
LSGQEEGRVIRAGPTPIKIDEPPIFPDILNMPPHTIIDHDKQEIYKFMTESLRSGTISYQRLAELKKNFDVALENYIKNLDAKNNESDDYWKNIIAQVGRYESAYKDYYLQNVRKLASYIQALKTYKEAFDEDSSCDQRRSV